jgi:hypothetical protein
MHFSARSALIVSSCLALGVRALPVTYSVVDVDGGSAAAATPAAGSGSGSGASSDGSADKPATVYVTKSTEVEEPEATTVSVSITIVETKHAMPKPTNASPSSSPASASSSPSPSKASAKAPSTTLTPSSTDALSVLSSAHSTLMTRPTKPSPSPFAAPQSSSTDLGEDCDCANVTATADIPNVTETVVPTQETVVILSTTTVVSDAAPTSYYDDGMWHTRYAIKPSAVPEKPAAKAEDAAPKVNVVFEAAGKKVEDVSAPAEKKQPEPQSNEPVSAVATNATSQAINGTHQARRQVQPATPTLSEEFGTGAPKILVNPIRPQPSGIAPHVEPNVVARAAPTGNVADVLAAEVDPNAAGLAERATPTGYSVVSWNETMQA